MYIRINTFEFELEKSNLNYLIYLYESKILTPKYYMPHLCINNESIIDSNGINVKFKEFKHIITQQIINHNIINQNIINITKDYYSYYDIIIGTRINSLNENEITFIMVDTTKALESMSIDINHVIDNIYIGNMCAAIDNKLLDSNNIRSIIQIITNFEPLFKNKYSYHVISIEDSPNVDISKYFDDFFQFIENNSDKNILIHCQHGSSRSGTFLILYLMKFKKMTYEEAFKFAKSKRYCVNPNRGFRNLLCKFAC